MCHLVEALAPGNIAGDKITDDKVNNVSLVNEQQRKEKQEGEGSVER
jgi:hypothetical protein